MRVDETITIQRRTPNGSKESYHKSDRIATAMHDTARSYVEHAGMAMQQLMEAEVSQQLGAEKSERAGSRNGYRCGYRPRRLDTRMGTMVRGCGQKVGQVTPRTQDTVYIPKGCIRLKIT